MPSFVFTADSSTNELTKTAHGLLTGDGAAVVWNNSGALPAPLAPETDYWIIRVDNDKVKLATSQANALAGTAIDLTTNGTGTNSLGIGLPYRRARTYAALAQVRSVDLNSIQDVILAARTIILNIITGNADNNTIAFTGNQGGVVNIVAGIGGIWRVPINLAVGERIKNVRGRLRDHATGPTVIRMAYRRGDALTGGEERSVLVSSSGAGTEQQLSLTNINDTVALNKTYEVSYDITSGPGGNAVALRQLEIDVDRG